MRILSIFNKKDEQFLRQKTEEVINPQDPAIRELIDTMRDIMEKNQGVGLAANQIGKPWRIFVAEYQNQFFAFINPKIIKHSRKTTLAEEGCLSVPHIVGVVPRYDKIVIEGRDLNNKKFKIKASGMLARIFQHETDHLDGILFIDKAKELYHVKSSKND
ncbi:MAG TPA: peptide deformylase [Candidatus Paceibacterota bacterium]|nr:peptide deformylase [Candidatus Paceibacterota bacterium]HOL53806.1 peptide deformylase [Candidatus Paceibacterota bacterium]HON21569.1 peptide deformylase [Candidatus Paceibacterota bacterium]HPP16947.1 peptide deformylase [Candidatus Paceibacterota bacterium]HRU33444.1 peptide deformylase [Candidatus Paceibacterota bacterium]